MDFRADLHCHSTCSDGTLSPEELLLRAKECGLKGLAITDHDTVAAYSAAIPFANEIGIELITGIELSTSLYGESVHILGYCFDYENPAIKAICKKHEERRLNRNREILMLLSKQNMPISENDLIKDLKILPHTIGRPHIAQAMITKGYVLSIADAFNKYLGENKPCFVRGNPITIQETYATIKQANGLAVIAHPHLIKNSQIIRELLKMKWDGIEGYYARIPKAKEERWLRVGKEKGWIVTGGSDFHGTVKPTIPLGSSWVPEETFRYLQQHYQHNIKS